MLLELLEPLLNEQEQISTRVLDILLARIIEPQKSNNKDACALATSLIKKGNEHFEFFVQNHLNNILLSSTRAAHHQTHYNLNTSDNNDSFSDFASTSNSSNANASSSNSSQFISDKLCLIIYELSSIRYNLLELVMPQLEYKLKSSEQKERREYTKLLSKMFSEKDSKLAKQLPQLWDAYLDRFGDANEDIREICVRHICDFLLQQSSLMKSQDLMSGVAGSNSTTSTVSSSSSSPKRSSTALVHHMDSVGGSSSSNHELDQIIEQIKSRALDTEESIRFEVVQEIIKALKTETNLITNDLLEVLKARTLDVKVTLFF